MTEELVYSISTKNTDLQKTYELRFEGVDLEKRPPLTGYEASDLLSPNKSPTGPLPSQIRESSGNTSDQGSSARGGRRFKPLDFFLPVLTSGKQHKQLSKTKVPGMKRDP